MGSKRPDQYRPGEAGVTDYKTRVEDEQITDEHHQKFAESRKEASESMIPNSGDNPALADLKQQREEAAAQDDDSENEDH